MNAPPVQFVTTSDGYSIAYCESGEGQPLVLMPAPMSHVQLYWTEDTWYRPWLQGLASRFRLIQYDSRGQGMSTRGLSDDISWQDLGRDLEAVVERLRLRDFVLMAPGPFGHTAVRYAVAHPDRIRALVWSVASMEAVASRALYDSLAEEDWEAFLSSLGGRSGASNLDAAVARLKQATTQADWLVLIRALQRSDVAADLPRLSTPTLLVHPRGFGVPVAQANRVAAAIPNARLIAIDGSNLGDLDQGLRAIEEFLAGLPAKEDAPALRAGPHAGTLSAREVDVLKLIAAGKSNAQIADELVISQNTAIRHVSNIFAKIGAANRAEAAAYATRNGLA